MGSLSDEQIAPAYPFQITGFFQLKARREHGGKIVKCHKAVFVNARRERSGKILKCHKAVFVCFVTP